MPCPVLLHQLLLGSRKTRAGCAWTLLRAAGNQRLQLPPSIHTLHGNKQGKKNTPSPRAGSRAGAGSCWDGPRDGGTAKLTLSPVPSTESSLGSAPQCHLPTRAGTLRACSPHPARPGLRPPSLPAATSQTFSGLSSCQQTRAGLSHGLGGRVSPNLPCTAPRSSSQSCSCQIQAELPQPTRISPPSLAPGLAAPEVGLTSLGEQGETQQLCTCPQLMSDLFRRKSGLSGMKELEAAAWGWHKTG